MTTRSERAMSFGLIAEDYDRLRPGPPDEAVDWLVPTGCGVAVDLGAGTGLLTRKLTSRASHVIAVEPDDRMSAVLRARSPEVEVLKGTAEEIPLPDACADGVFVSSAWHWMDPDRAVPEICRVLRDGGRFGVVWAGRDRQVEWLHELSGITSGNGTGPDGTGSDSTGSDSTGSDSTGSDRVSSGHTPSGHSTSLGGPHGAALPPAWPFRQVETGSFGFTRAMTVEAIVALLATYSGLISASLADRAAVLARAVAALSQRFPGAQEIDVPMRASCWRADRVPR
ncbi:MAG: class I SAM-dependent methyltransferase [Actinomycetota bacterium]